MDFQIKKGVVVADYIILFGLNAHSLDKSWKWLMEGYPATLNE